MWNTTMTWNEIKIPCDLRLQNSENVHMLVMCSTKIKLSLKQSSQLAKKRQMKWTESKQQKKQYKNKTETNIRINNKKKLKLSVYMHKVFEILAYTQLNI